MLHGVKRYNLCEKHDESQKFFEYKETLAYYYDSKSLMASASILLLNPEYYPAWNTRKKGLKNLDHSGLEDELLLTFKCIKNNPKSYSSWYHRKWIIQKGIKSGIKIDIAKELHLIHRLLDLDSRNFHCWNYRAFLAHLYALSLPEELEFTTNRLKIDFSNYSAWHRRQIIFEKINFDLGKELELVERSVWTMPSDESPWLHWRWIISKCFEGINQSESTINQSRISFFSTLIDRSTTSLKELLDLEPSALYAIFMIAQINVYMGKSVQSSFERLSQVDPMRNGLYKLVIK